MITGTFPGNEKRNYNGDTALGNLDATHITSYRAISFGTGKDLWRLDVKWPVSYSRDMDGSAVVTGDDCIIGSVEITSCVINSIFLF